MTQRSVSGKRIPVSAQRPEVRLLEWVTKLESGWRPYPGQRPRALIRDLKAAIAEMDALGEACMQRLNEQIEQNPKMMEMLAADASPKEPRDG